MFFSPTQAEADKHNLDQDEFEDDNEEEVRSKVALLLELADKGGYGSLSNGLKEGIFLGRDKYPTTVATMYN